MSTVIKESEILLKETYKLPNDLFKTDVGSPGANQQQETKNIKLLLNSYGWTISPELTFHLESLSKDSFCKHRSLIVDFAKKITGVDFLFTPLFKNFPNISYTDYYKFWFDSFHYPKVRYNEGFNLLEERKKFEENKETIMESYVSNFKCVSLGGSIQEEKESFLKSRLGSKIPLSEETMANLEYFLQNESTIKDYEVSIKEVLALYNFYRVEKGQNGIYPTLTDILRFAVKVTGGDVSLTKNTKFKTIKRKYRRAIFAAIDQVCSKNLAVISDAHANQEIWKRLGEKLHPHESNSLRVKALFAEVRGETKLYPSLASQQEALFATKDKTKVLEFYSKFPSLLGRSLDRVLREFPDIKPSELKVMFSSFSSRVIIGVIQQLENRGNEINLYINKLGKSWLDKDRKLASIEESTLEDSVFLLKQELSSRMKSYSDIHLAKEMENIALPLTDKHKSRGIGILPVGSVMNVDSTSYDTLRFFIYWHQNHQRTDYDLSCLFLDSNYTTVQTVSFRNLQAKGCKHSGDFTSAPNGAAEFIDVEFDHIPKNVKYIIPQINLFGGETFDNVKEVFFGFMERNQKDTGNLFDPKSVKMRSELFGDSQVALPVVFIKNEETNTWQAKWIHQNLNSGSFIGMVERNKASTTTLVKAIVDKKYFTIKDIVEVAKIKTANKTKELVEGSLIISTSEIEVPQETKDTFITPLFLQNLIP